MDTMVILDADVRELKSVTRTTWQLPADSLLAMEAEKAIAMWQERRPTTGPHPDGFTGHTIILHLFRYMCLLAESQDVNVIEWKTTHGWYESNDDNTPLQLVPALAQFQQEIAALKQPRVLARDVPICKFKLTHKTKEMRAKGDTDGRGGSLLPGTLQVAFEEMLLAAGGELLTGPPPPGPLVRSMQ